MAELNLEHRPFAFEDLVGQYGIKQEMLERSKTCNFPTVSFLLGPSGTGKTTTALIMAALLNDPNPIQNEDGTYRPNPESPACKDIINENFSRSVHFFDASTMGKQDVVELISLASKAPLMDKKRIIIIDEAQELGKASKGATLKLLEKKRKNTHIILCTMDGNSFNKAILSRGMNYVFKNVNTDDISDHLMKIMEKTGDIEDDTIPDAFYEEGLLAIAENARGSVRQAVSLLERCLIGKFFSEEEITEEFGFIKRDTLYSVLELLFNRDKLFFNEVIKLSLEDFYYKSFKMLTSAMIYSYSNKVEEDWKLAMAKRLSQHKNFDEVLDMYVTVKEKATAPYFNEDMFFYYVHQFMKATNSTPRPTLQEKTTSRVATTTRRGV